MKSLIVYVVVLISGAMAGIDTLSSESALDTLRVRRKNSGMLEEVQGDSYERECVEEMCDYEELFEIYPSDPQLVAKGSVFYL